MWMGGAGDDCVCACLRRHLYVCVLILLAFLILEASRHIFLYFFLLFLFNCSVRGEKLFPCSFVA